MQRASDDGDNCTITIDKVSTTHYTSPQNNNVEMRLDTSSIRNHTEPVNARNILIRFQQFKWSILAFICGVILTLVIVVPVMVSKSSSQENGILIYFNTLYFTPVKLIENRKIYILLFLREAVSKNVCKAAKM